MSAAQRPRARLRTALLSDTGRAVLGCLLGCALRALTHRQPSDSRPTAEAPATRCR